MKTVKFFKTAVIILILSFSSCSHIDNFDDYNIAYKKVTFITKVADSKSDAKVKFGDGSFGVDKNITERIISAIGSELLEAEVEEKLGKIINPDEVAGTISWDIKSNLQTFTNIIVVDSLLNNPDIVAETNLLGFRLVSSANGIMSYITVEFTLTDMESGKYIWKNKETIKRYLKESITEHVPERTIRKAGSIINAIRLIEMSEDEIKQAIKLSAEEVSSEILKILRTDISESAK